MANRVTSTLLRSARAYAGQLKTLVKSFAPKHLRNSVQAHANKVSEGVIKITVSASGADAHAQEYGSGLHTDGRKGVKAKYPIRPKPGNTALAFRENAKGTWDYSRGNPPPIPKYYTLDGRGLFFGVMHPGIRKYQGRGYINPAIREFRKRIKQKTGLRSELRQAFLGEIDKAFEGAKRK